MGIETLVLAKSSAQNYTGKVVSDLPTGVYYKGSPWETNEQFRGAIYQCDVFNYAITETSLETIYLTTEGTEASLNGWAIISIPNKTYIQHTVRAIDVDIAYDLIRDNLARTKEVFQIKLINNVADSISVPDDQYRHYTKMMIPLSQYTDAIKLYESYDM